MPFLVPEQIDKHILKIWAFRSVQSRTGLTYALWKNAFEQAQKGLRVLVFDEMLGLPNTPYKNKKETNIPQVFAGNLPLNTLIDSTNNVDFIAGLTKTNLNALSTHKQNHLKTELLTLAQNYDLILLDSAFQRHSPFIEPTHTFWVAQPDQKMILKVLQCAPNGADIILNKISKEDDLLWLSTWLKQLSPKSCIYQQIYSQK